MVIQFNHILVYSENEEDHALQQVIRFLSQEKLYGNQGKSHFFTSHVIFLGYVVSLSISKWMIVRLRPSRSGLFLPQFSK